MVIWVFHHLNNLLSIGFIHNQFLAKIVFMLVIRQEAYEKGDITILILSIELLLEAATIIDHLRYEIINY
jgi:hypothetical protein